MAVDFTPAVFTSFVHCSYLCRLRLDAREKVEVPHASHWLQIIQIILFFKAKGIRGRPLSPSRPLAFRSH